MSDHAAAEPAEAQAEPNEHGDEEMGKKGEDIERSRSLYDDARALLEASVLMYGIADVRKLTRSGDLVSCDEDPDALQRLLDLPCTNDDILRVYNANKEVMLKQINNDKQIQKMYHTALMYRFSGLAPGEATQQDAQLLVFDDVNSEKECVYGIFVNHKLKRIGIGFRGSVTRVDWIKDLRQVMDFIPNPVKSNKTKQPKKISIMLGFKDYIYGEVDFFHFTDVIKPNIPSLKQHSKHNRKVPKCKAILDMLASLCAEHPDYAVYFTGHSLGGSLATLLALEAAASTDERISKPVTLITFASPKVGGLDFRFAIQTLEEEKKLRILRVANETDVISWGPGHGIIRILDVCLYNKSIFRHNGVSLTLVDPCCCPHKRKTFRISHPPCYNGVVGRLQLVFHDLGNVLRWTFMMITMFSLIGCCFCHQVGAEAMKQHSLNEYRSRLVRAQEELENLFLNDIYNDKVKRGLYEPSENFQHQRRSFWGRHRSRTSQSSKTN